MARKILVVDDNEMNRMLVRDMLEYYNYEVIEAENGLEGIRAAKKHKPDLILTDVQMPVMDGITAMKELRKDPETRGIKIVVLTSFAMNGDEKRILEEGFDGYMAKPFGIKDLIEAVEKMGKSVNSEQ
jgi:two-component system cell cycle response regulator DivK